MAASFQELLNTGVIGGGQGNQGPTAQTGGAAGGVVAALTGGKLPEVNTLERLSTQGFLAGNMNGFGATARKQKPTWIDGILHQLQNDPTFQQNSRTNAVFGGVQVGPSAAGGHHDDIGASQGAGQITAGAAVAALSSAKKAGHDEGHGHA